MEGGHKPAQPGLLRQFPKISCSTSNILGGQVAALLIRHRPPTLGTEKLHRGRPLKGGLIYLGIYVHYFNRSQVHLPSTTGPYRNIPTNFTLFSIDFPKLRLLQ